MLLMRLCWQSPRQKTSNESAGCRVVLRVGRVVACGVVFDVYKEGRKVKMSWNIYDVEVGAYIETQVSNKRGGHNLDGAIIKGIIKDIVVTHNMVRLESGWCCHTKDTLLTYVPRKGGE